MKITIPKTIREATDALGALDDLVTAKEWTRAAIVYAFTYDTKGGQGTGRKTSRFSCTEFAQRGVHGLTNKDTVSAYRTAWKEAISAGEAEDIDPGDRVDLPDISWKDRSGRDTTQYVRKNPNSMGRAVNAMDDVAVDTFTQNLSASAAEAIVSRITEDRPAVVTRVVNEAPSVARAVAHQARYDEYEKGVTRARSTSDVIRQSADEHPAVQAGLRAVQALRMCVRNLDGVRMTKGLRNELAIILDGGREALDAIEMASEVNGTVGEEVEAFLASLGGDA